MSTHCHTAISMIQYSKYQEVTMYKAAIFDLDGTLLNSARDLEEACNYALSKYSLPNVDSQSFTLRLGSGRRKLIESIVNDFFDHGKKEIIEEFQNYFNEYYDAHLSDYTRPYEGVNEGLETLTKNNIITAVLSNKPHDFTIKLVNHFFGDNIKYISGLKDGYEPKPDPKALLGIISDLRVKKDECIYIGDSEVDIRVSKNAGIKSLGGLWGFRDEALLKKEGADFLASSVNEMVDIIIKQK